MTVTIAVLGLLVAVGLVQAVALGVLPGGAVTGLSGRARDVGRGGRVVVLVLGWIALVVAVDLVGGWLWEAWRGGPDRQTQQAAVTVEGQIPRDPRADSPGFEGVPWAEDYLDELSLQRYDYKPFLIGTLVPSRGEYVNTDEGLRHSYQPDGAEGPDAVEVWFFGGSTMFGEGQRDGHTIPSEVARLAEQDGVVVRPVNFGSQGYLLWQEMLRFEMELALRGPPDLAVFYDGTNDFNYQLADQQGQPTHGDQESAVTQLTGAAAPLPADLAPPPISIWDRLAEASLAGRLAEQVGDLATVPPAGASPAGEAPEPDPNEDPQGLAEDVADVYGRSVEMARVLAEDAGVPATFFWQPVKRPPFAYELVSGLLPAGVVDLSDAYQEAGLDDSIFIDGGHTNEVGARAIAEAIYPHLRPDLVGGPDVDR